MRLHPVVNEPATVVDAVSESLREPLELHSELDVDVYRLRRTQPEPDLVVRAFGPGVERASVDAVVDVLHRWLARGSPPSAARQTPQSYRSATVVTC